MTAGDQTFGDKTWMDDIHQLESLSATLDGDPHADIHRRIDVLNDLAWALADTDMKRAYALADQACALAETAGGEGTPYETGLAYGLRSLGYLNQRFGDYPLGLTQLLRAQPLCEALGLNDGLADVLDGIAGIYGQISEYPEALNTMFQQLEVAERSGDPRRIANANNNLINIYMVNGEVDRALEALQSLLDTALAIDYPRMVSLAYMNLAEVYLTTGDYERALTNARLGLEVNVREGFELFEVYALNLIGQINLNMGEPGKVIPRFAEALARSREIASAVTEALVLLNMGRAYRTLQQPSEALDALHACLRTAESIDAQFEQYEAHLSLSELYEAEGDLSRALYHLKQHQAVKERVFSERSDQRLKVLQVVYDTENARKEAEILHLRTVELEKQVQERTAEIQQMVDQLEQRVADRSRELAALYDMTILFTEATNLREMLDPALRSIRASVEASGIAIHILSADRSHLELSASLGVGETDRIQAVALTPGLEDWLRLAEAPLMFVGDGEGYPFFPKALLFAENPTYLGLSLRIREDIIGLISVYRAQPEPFDIRSVSLQIMIAEQLGVIIQNYQLQQQSKHMTRTVERQRLARELHDSVAQRIYSLNLFARGGQDALADGDIETARLRLQQVEENALYSLREMRLLLYQLRPPALESQSLVAAFEERFDLVERRLGIKAHVNAAVFPELDGDVGEELYYIITEALNNSLKHALATQVELRFSSNQGRLVATIVDDGCGFDLGRHTSGLGLRNMTARAAKINGDLTILTGAGEGTTVRVSL